MVTNDIVIFDKQQIKHNRIRAARKFSDHDFLHRWSKNQLLDRLSDVNRIFSSAACIGSRCPIESNDHEKIKSGCVMDITPAPITPCTSPYINADE